MRIERIFLENFRRFAHADLEMPDGVIALVGRNGAGKSTLLEAIGWCLFGHEAARTGKDLLKRRGAAPSDDVRVRLAFRFGGHAYEVTRELLGKSGGHSATVLVDGAVVVNPGAQSGREAAQYVARLLHMDREAFFTSLVARQRELAALSEAQPAKRKALLMSLLRIDAVDEAIRQAREGKRDARRRLEGLRAALVDPAPLRAQMEEARAQRVKLADEATALEARVAALAEEVEALRAQRDTGRRKGEAFRALSHDLRAARKRLEDTLRDTDERARERARAQEAAAQAAALVPRLEGLDAARARLERLQALRIRSEEAARLSRAIAQAAAEHAQALAEAEAAARNLAAASGARRVAERLPETRARIEEMASGAQQSAAAAEAQMNEVRHALRQLDAKLARVQELGPESPCPTCTRPLREHHGALVHELEGERAALLERLDGLAPRLEQARRTEREARVGLRELAEREAEILAKLEKAAAEEARLDGARARASDALARKERLAADLRVVGSGSFDPAEEVAARAALDELTGLERQRLRLQAEADRLPGVEALLAELAARAQALTEEITRLQAQMAALAFDVEAHEAIERRVVATEERLQRERILREQLRGAIARQADAEARLQQEIARQETLARQAEALEGEARLLERLAGDRDQGLLPEFKDHLIGRIRPLLTLHAGQLFRELTDGRYADLEVGEDYDLLVHEDGEAYGLSRFSGGESDLANLCLRLAVGQVVAERAGTDGFSFLALDEIFGSQDEVRKGNILRCLNALASRFRQILLITHVEDVKEAAEHVLRVEALEDGTSRLVMES